ncbi:MAG: N-acetylmuramoyl-L-alanine amidase [Paludibacteraceae bacterium]|nr:N-acetylmuramoyl-L-alanine amidase [Paludibacteraceae bacterium]
MRKFLLLLSILATSLSANAFTVVLDAGHGGHDSGAVGSMSNEKTLNLNHVLLLGKMLEAECPDIRVVYTRKTDEFIDLNRRAQIANNAKADLFVSVHINASKNKEAKGAETFTLGVSKSKASMEVAMFENSVILLENDYQKNYQGFDPNSTDSYIMFEFMKDQYLDRSVEVANEVHQRLVKSSGRVDRGVRQAGFLVLRATSMPAILVELGFISNAEEEKALNNADNQKKTARALFDGIVAYKRNIDKKNGIDTETPAPAVQPQKAAEPAPLPATADSTAQSAGDIRNTVRQSLAETGDTTVVFLVQVLLSGKQLEPNDPVFKGVPGIEAIYEGGYYKYCTGRTEDPDEAFQTRNQVIGKFPDAFLTARKGSRRVPLQEAIQAYRNKQNNTK